MKLISISIALFLTFSCGHKNSEQTIKKDKNSLTIKYLFENNRDTVELADTVDFAMTFSNNEFDSLSVFIGQLDSLTLVDTTAILEVNKNSVFFSFIPTELGTNNIEGLVKEYDKQGNRIVVKSTVFSFNYYCEQQRK